MVLVPLVSGTIRKFNTYMDFLGNICAFCAFAPAQNWPKQENCACLFAGHGGWCSECALQVSRQRACRPKCLGILLAVTNAWWRPLQGAAGTGKSRHVTGNGIYESVIMNQDFFNECSLVVFPDQRAFAFPSWWQLLACYGRLSGDDITEWLSLTSQVISNRWLHVWSKRFSNMPTWTHKCIFLGTQIPPRAPKNH